MAITSAICNSYKQEILEGVHASGDTYKIALFTDVATLGASTTTYAATNQVIDGFAKTKAIEAKITIGKVNAFGLIVINGGAVLQSVSAVAQVPNLQANGVLGISEEELVLFLMAA